MRDLTRAQLIVGAVTVVALAVGVTAFVLALRPPPPPPSYHPTAPPLALASGQATPSGANSGEVTVTVRIVVPAGHINLGVVEGDGLGVPMNLAAHYPGTAQPGASGNAVYYAHAQPGMFQGLYQVHLGDVVEAMRTDGSALVFHVRAVKYVKFNDRSVLDQTPYGEVTLLTCTSYDPYTPRLIVIATVA